MNQEQIIYPPSKRIEDADAKLEDEFTLFICERGYSADQVWRAYERLLGDTVPDEADLAVDAILAEMQRLEKAHCPVSRFASVIDTFRRMENAVPDYLYFVSRLAATDGEKAMLRSLVQQLKPGKLVVTVDGRSVCTVEVRGLADGQVTVASEVVSALKRAKAAAEPGQLIAYTFTEHLTLE
jgi:hypothetical protein